jgi:hypothetical protein
MRVATSLVLSGLAAGMTLAVQTTACAPKPDRSVVTDVLTPDFPTYKTHVDAYLQRRCGTLDCHGQPGRAYRLYGFSGLRMAEETDGGLVSGQQPTTDDEIRANFESAVALEPEEMTRLMATQGAEPNRLLLLRKPLLLERHKGGPSMAENDSGYRCVVAWLRLRTVRETGDGEDFESIPPDQREAFSARAQQDCEEAKSFP